MIDAKEAAARAGARMAAGMNCCQSVLCAFAPEYGLSETDALRLSEGMGGGMGGMKGTCGAVTGMFLAAGLALSAGDMQDPKATKDTTYAAVRALAERFRAQHGALDCSVLEPKDAEVKKVVCRGYVESAAAILAETLAARTANSVAPRATKIASRCAQPK